MKLRRSGSGTFGPTDRCQIAVSSHWEVVDVDVEFALALAVRDWTRGHCPDERRVADKAVMLALSSYAGGASVAEASEQARAFVSSWIHHPAHQSARQGDRFLVAS